MHDGLENFLDADAHLGAAIDRFFRRNREDVLELLVDRGMSAFGRSILLMTGMIVSPCLCARCTLATVCASTPCAASTINKRAFTRGQRARDFVGKIDVPGRIDEIELDSSVHPWPCNAS